MAPSAPATQAGRGAPAGAWSGNTWQHSPRPSPPPTGGRSSRRPRRTPRPATRRPGTGCQNTWWATSRSPWSSWPKNCKGSSPSWGWAMKPAAMRRELANLRQTVRDEAALLPALPLADDAGELARELAGAFGRVVKEYREFFQLTPEEARARAGEPQPGHL